MKNPRNDRTILLSILLLALVLRLGWALVFYGGSLVALPAAPAFILMASAGLADLLPRLNPNWTWLGD